MAANSDPVSEVLKLILERPGISRDEFARHFRLSDYRLNRVLRQIDRRLSEQTVINSRSRGVWIIPLNPGKCQGVEWAGAERGGFVQCDRDPEFSDGCCFEHSQCEHPEMVAFYRHIAYLTGPAEASARSISGLSPGLVEELHDELQAIEPLTRKDTSAKERLLNVILAAKRFHMWKERMRRAQRSWVPPELLRRHWESSINPFEYSLKKHFAILEITSDATREEVVKAWRALAQRYHPDTGHGDEEIMKTVNKAKEQIFIVRGWKK
jgi:hypothetical protein